MKSGAEVPKEDRARLLHSFGTNFEGQAPVEEMRGYLQGKDWTVRPGLEGRASLFTLKTTSGDGFFYINTHGARIAVAGEREEQAACLEIVGERTPVARRDMREQDLERFRRARSTESLERGEAQAPVRRSESCRERRQFVEPEAGGIADAGRARVPQQRHRPAVPERRPCRCGAPVRIVAGGRHGRGGDRKQRHNHHRGQPAPPAVLDDHRPLRSSPRPVATPAHVAPPPPAAKVSGPVGEKWSRDGRGARVLRLRRPPPALE